MLLRALALLFLSLTLLGQADAPQTAAPKPAATQVAPEANRRTSADSQPPSYADSEVPDYLQNTQPPAELNSGSYLNTLSSLLLVLGIILTLAWVAKRFFPNRLGMGLGQAGTSMRLLQSLPLGQRRYLSLVEVDGRRFMIGVTDTQINLIKALDEVGFSQELAQVDTPRTVQELMDEETL